MNITCINIGEPEENPGVYIEPIQDPVPREQPKEVPQEPKPKKEPVPA